jgi:ATP-dependent Lon protease
VVAEVTKRHTIRGTDVMSLDALHRGVPGIAHGDHDGVLRVEVDEHPDVAPPQELTADLEREYRAVVEEILELRGDDGRISAFVRSITEPGALADTAGYSPDLNNAQKLELLETLDIVERLSLSLKFQRERLAELQVRKRIREDVENGAQKQQRDYFLRKQMDAIRKELGENEASVTEDYRKKIAEAGMPDVRPRAGRARAVALRAARRPERRVVGDPDVSRLAAGGAVVEAIRRRHRSAEGARGARRRPLRA